MNDLVRIEDQLPAGGDGFDAPHEEGGSEYIRGTIVTFVDKEFKDRDDNPMNDAELIAVAFKRAWRKFTDAGPVHVPPQANGYLCDRNSLGDLDRDLWEFKFNDYQDPWQNARYLWLFDRKTAKPYTFVTATSGGRHAVEGLKDQIQLQRRIPGNENLSPIVKLKWAQWGRQFPKSRPDFQVIGWTELGGGQPAVAQQQPRAIGNPLGGDPEPPPSNDFNDSIPF